MGLDKAYNTRTTQAKDKGVHAWHVLVISQRTKEMRSRNLQDESTRQDS